MNILNKVLKVGVLKLVSIPLGLLLSITLARFLGPKEFGQYTFIIALIPLICIPISGGISQLLVRSVAEYSQGKDLPRLNGIICFSMSWILAFSLVLILIIQFLTYFELISERSTLFQIGIFIAPLIAFMSMLSGVLKGLKQPVYSEMMTQIFWPLMSLLFIAAYIYYDGLNIQTALLSQITSLSCCVIIFTIITLKKLPTGVFSIARKTMFKQWCIALAPFTLIVLANTFNTQIGIIVLGLHSSEEAVGGLRIAERGAQFVSISLGIINGVYSPYIVNAYKNNDAVRLKQMAKQISRGAFLIAAPISAIFILFGKPIISLAFGEEYVALSYTPMIILIIGQLVNVCFGAVGNFLTMTGHERLTFKGQIIALLINCIGCMVLVPIYGALGAAIGVSFGLVTWNLILFYFVYNKLKINTSVF